MLKVSLRHHTPESVYDQLERRFGPLYMTIKNGHCLINFKNPERNQQVLLKCKNIVLEGLMLRISKYQDGELDRHESKDQSRDQDILKDVLGPEPANALRQLVYRSRKELIDLVVRHTSLDINVQNKQRQLSQSYFNQALLEQEAKLSELIRSHMVALCTTIKNSLRSVSRQVKQFCSKNKTPINLNPTFMPIRSPIQEENRWFQFQGLFEEAIDFINEERLSVKRIVPMSDTSFACSLKTGYKKGKLKIYDVSRELRIDQIDINQGPYGLLKLGNFLVTGNEEGRVNFVNLSQADSKEIVSHQMHTQTIFDLLSLHHNSQRAKILTVSNDKTIKLWQVEQLQIREDLHTLEFIYGGLEIKGREGHFIMGVEVNNDEQFLYGCNNIIYRYNHLKKIAVGEIKSKYKVRKLRKVSNTLMSTANEKHISVIDLRSQLCVMEFPFLTEIKDILPIAPQLIFYGDQEGQVGVGDLRTVRVQWKNNNAHKKKVGALTRLKDVIISGDDRGQLIGWKNHQGD